MMSLSKLVLNRDSEYCIFAELCAEDKHCHRQIKTNTNTDKQIDKDKQRQIKTNKNRDKQTEKDKHRHTDTNTNTDTHIDKDKQKHQHRDR